MSNNPSTPGMTVYDKGDANGEPLDPLPGEELPPPKNVVVHSARNVNVYQPAGAGPSSGRYGRHARLCGLWGLLREFNMTAMSCLYGRKFSNGDDDAVVAIFSTPGVRRVGFHNYGSAAGGAGHRR